MCTSHIWHIFIQQLPTEHTYVRYPTRCCLSTEQNRQNQSSQAANQGMKAECNTGINNKHKELDFLWIPQWGKNNGKEYWDRAVRIKVLGETPLNPMLRAGLRSDSSLKWRAHTRCDAGNRRPFSMSIWIVTAEGFRNACCPESRLVSVIQHIGSTPFKTWLPGTGSTAQW